MVSLQFYLDGSKRKWITLKDSSSYTQNAMDLLDYLGISNFDNINKYDLVFEVYEDGTLLGTETVNNVSVEARSYGDANIPYKKYMLFYHIFLNNAKRGYAKRILYLLKGQINYLASSTLTTCLPS